MFQQLKLIAKALCPPGWKILLSIIMSRKSEVNPLMHLLKNKSPWNFIENLLALYIHVRTYSFAKGQILSHKMKHSRLKSRSLWTSLKNMDFRNWQVSLTMELSIFMATNNRKTKMAALFALVLIKIRRKKQEKLFWLFVYIYHFLKP